MPELIKSLKTDSAVEVLTIDDDLFDKSFNLFVNRDDREWSLTDCMSFVVMDLTQTFGLQQLVGPLGGLTRQRWNRIRSIVDFQIVSGSVVGCVEYRL